MNTIHYYSQLAKHLSSMTSVLQALASHFESVEERTELDEQFINNLVASATSMLTEASNLNTIIYNPTDPPAPEV
jgi:hypothetical protein